LSRAWHAAWHAAGVVSVLAVFDDGAGPALDVGGSFVSVGGGLVSRNLAAWRCGVVFADGFETGDARRWSLTPP
jgi:hypothetical protein